MTSSEFGSRLRVLCDWAASQRNADIPLRAMQRARWILADDLAAIVAGSAEPEVQAYHRLGADRSAAREATIICPGFPMTGRWQATTANSVAGNWCELDEGFRHVPCHAGLYTLPALLAEAEVSRLTLADVLRCLVIAYECVTRLALCFRFQKPPVHAHALWTPMAAAAAVSVARGYDAKTLFSAISAAATSGLVGPRPHLTEGVLIRNAWAAMGAVVGTQCADLAACGIGGVDSSAPAVFCDILGATSDPDALSAELGTRWSVDSGYHKLYACCQHGHSAVEALLNLTAPLPDLEAIATIEACTHPLALALTNPRPTTSLGAKFSMPHMIAAALVYRSGGPTSFSPNTLVDPRMVRLRNKVQLKPYEGKLEPPHDRPARIVITMNDGRRIVAECLSAYGGPDRPLTEDQLLDKIAQLGGPLLPRLTHLVQSSSCQFDARPWRDVLTALAMPVDAPKKS
jgi:2-methylcitrate dehydratase PrpD